MCKGEARYGHVFAGLFKQYFWKYFAISPLSPAAWHTIEPGGR